MYTYIPVSAVHSPFGIPEFSRSPHNLTASAGLPCRPVVDRFYFRSFPLFLSPSIRLRVRCSVFVSPGSREDATGNPFQAPLLFSRSSHGDRDETVPQRRANRASKRVLVGLPVYAEQTGIDQRLPRYPTFLIHTENLNPNRLPKSLAINVYR